MKFSSLCTFYYTHTVRTRYVRSTGLTVRTYFLFSKSDDRVHRRHRETFDIVAAAVYVHYRSFEFFSRTNVILYSIGTENFIIKHTHTHTYAMYL